MAVTNEEILLALRDEATSLTAKIDAIAAVQAEHGKKLDEHGKKLDEHSNKFDEHSNKFDEQGKKLDVLTEITETHSQRLTAIEAEQRQIKSMVGGLVVKEVARLDGRIDQLAQDTALGRRAS